MIKLGNFIKNEKFPLLILLIAFIALTILTFNKWGDISCFDNAREMLLPYWILKGKILYKDIFYFYGPIVPYFMAILYWLFEPGFKLIFSLGIISAFCYLLIFYYFARMFLDKYGAVFVSLLFLVQLVFFNTGTFSYIYPYAYSAMIGSLLTLIVLIFVLKHFSSDNKKFLWLSALCCLLALFLKQDCTISCFGILAGYLFFFPLTKIDWQTEVSLKKITSGYIKNFPLLDFIKLFGTITLGFIVLFAIIGFYTGYLNLFEGIFAFHVMKTGLADYLNKEFCKYDFTFENISRALYFAIASFSLFFGFITLSYYYVKIFKSLKFLYRQLFVVATVLVMAFIIVKTPLILFLFGSHPFPYVGFSLWLIAVFFYCLANLSNKNNMKLLIVVCAAFLSIYRMVFNLELTLYTFYLFPIGLLVFVYIILNLMPKVLLKEKHFSRELWVKCARVFLILFIVYYFIVNIGLYSKKTIKITNNFGTQYLGERDSFKIYKAMELVSLYIKNNTDPEDKILVVSEEIYIYLLADRESSSKFYYLLPEIFPKDSDYKDYIDHIKEGIPRFIVVSTRDFMLYGVGALGSEKFYPEVLHIIEHNYKKVRIIKIRLKNVERTFTIYEKN